MMMNVLVTYASLYGATKEVAESIAAAMRRNGFIVEVRDVATVKSVEAYDAIVLGTPLYVGRWRKEAHTFLDNLREQLVVRPVAIFSLGPISADEKEMQDARQQFDNELAKYTWLKPIATDVFVGKYNPDKLGFAHRLLARIPGSPLHDLPASDLRDWQLIEDWATDLAQQLMLEPA